MFGKLKTLEGNSNVAMKKYHQVPNNSVIPPVKKKIKKFNDINGRINDDLQGFITF